RNEAEALKKLQETVATSTNQTNEPAYRLFRGLSSDAQATLIRAITILPNAPNISDASEALRVQARLSVKRHHLDSFLIRLEGWWYRRAVEQLIDPDTPPILSNEIESAVDDIREQFQEEALPVDEDILNVEVDSTFYENSVFVQQVRLTGVGEKRIFLAIRDYYRAFQHRSRWIREDLILIGDLDKYERRLREEWEFQFARIADEIDDDATEKVKKEVAQKIYAWMEEYEYPIRPQVRERCITRGSFHILANELKVGWHPEFMQLLQKVLEPLGVS
ncbi:MAG TPA: ABC-three component system protein, partial [Allocoleopsis sp.]